MRSSLKQKTLRNIMLTLCLALFAGNLIAEETKHSATETQKNSSEEMRVLFIYGGHRFHQAPFYKMLDDLPGVVYKAVMISKTLDILKPGLEKDYDVVLMYDLYNMTAEQQENFIALLNTGIGVVSLHHTLYSNKYWGEFRKIIGGRTVGLRDREIDGKLYTTSAAQPNKVIPVQVADKEHPITQGISDFTLGNGEIYGYYYVSPKVHVILTTTHPDAQKEIAWTNSYGKSSIFYFLLGHDNHAWSNENYPKILLNAIRWAKTATEEKLKE